MAVRWTIPFKTLRSNELLTVNIYDSTFSGEAMVLMGAAEPFETHEEGGDDLFWDCLPAGKIVHGYGTSVD